MDTIYYFLFNKLKSAILRSFTIQVLYIFVLLQLLTQFVYIDHYNSLIFIMLFIIIYKFTEAFINYFQSYPKIVLIISTVIFLIGLLLINIEKYDVAKYISFEKQAFKIGSFDVFSILPLVVAAMFIIISLYYLFKDKIYFFITPLFCISMLFLVWNAGTEEKYNNIILIFIFTFFMDLLLHYYNKSKAESLKEKLVFQVNKKSIITYGTAVICIMLVFSVVLSSITGTKSLDQIRRDKIMKKMNNLNIHLFDSIKSKLGGPLNLDDKILFKIKGDPPKYLIGTVKSNYNGSQWINEYKDYFNKSNQPIYRNNDFKAIMGENEKRKLKVGSMEIIPVDASWKTLFVPNNIYNIKTKKNDIVYDKDYCFVSLSDISKESYTIEYYKSYTNIESINSPSMDYLDYDINSSQIKSDYRDYLELPENISDRTKSLVKDITKNCRNNTEKVLAIRNYLLNNYSYKTNMAEVPEDKEFVDNFLFNEKSGYCTYFATACTVMLRIAGIPSRYAEGYYVDENNFKNGYYNILENNGHAFAQVLLSPRANIWSVVESTPGYSGEKSSSIPYYARSSGNNYNYTGGLEVTKQKSTIESGDKSQTNLNANLIHIIFLIISILILTSIFCLIIIYYKKMKYIFNSKSNIPFYMYLRYRLNSIGFMKNASKPDLAEVNEIYDNDLRNLVIPLVESYYKEFYGEEKVTIDKRDIYYKFEKYMREKQGLTSYWWNKTKIISYFKVN